jgi:hypothetical protein
MTCHQARQQLAAYRRDDWTASDMRLLAEHLASCAACRQVEATYRRVGESLRLLPTLTPDASFRASVFAAIAADQRKLGPAAMRVSRAETEPSLPVVRAPVTPIRSISARRAQQPVTRAALAIAAVLALALFATQFIPSLDLGGFAANLFRGASSADLNAHITRYHPDARFHAVTGVRATSAWLAYTASDSTGATMLFVTDRSHNQTHPALAAPATGAVTIYALSSHWLIWSDTANGWTLHATGLTGASAWQTRQLAQSDGAGSILVSVWADDSHALVAVAPASGSGSILSIPLAGGAGNVIAHAAEPGALLTNPTSANGVVYWDDVWTDQSGRLHGAVWSSGGATSARLTQTGDEAYGVALAHGRLIWVNAATAPTVTATNAATLASTASRTQGAVEALSVTGGATPQMIDAHGVAGSVQAAGALAIWSDGATAHAWNLGQNAADPIAGQLGGATTHAVSADALAWFDGSRIAVYAD